MVKVEVKNNRISFLGHANYNDYGKDIVCAAVSATMMTSVEAIAKFDSNAITVLENNDKIELIQNKHDDITNKLINNMIDLLKELEKKYPKNIKIINKEE